MAKLRRLSGKEMLRFLEREGFALIRVRGSHHLLRRGGTTTIVPIHGNRSLKTGTLRKILREIDMTPAEFAQRFAK